MAIISSCVVLFIILVVLTAFIYRYRRDINCHALAVEVCNPSVVEAGSPNTTKKPICIDKFPHQMQQLQADSNCRLNREFDSIQKISLARNRCQEQKAGRRPENQSKNRYTDILPYDYNRVKLDSASSNYINASYIHGFENDVNYIASQGPMPSTLSDFWLMVWQNNINVIVMLTSLIEKGQVKCSQYWPSSGIVDYGNLSVSLVDETDKHFYIVRCLLLRPRSGNCATRIIRHLHFTTWPDSECPDDPQQLIHFIDVVRAESRLLAKDNPYLVLVHCSAGVGRTGTFIALDILMKQVFNNRMVDVFGTVLDIRKDRCCMVQTEEQYHFLYSCVRQYIQNYIDKINDRIKRSIKY